MATTKIAINGFGRIGRLTFRALIKDGKGVEVVAINDLTDSKTLAHLLKYDTAHGKFDGTVEAAEGAIIVNGKKIPIYAKRDPKELPWKSHGVDVVVESTGMFRTKEAANAHIIAGAKKVLISAPAKGDVKTIVYNVNHEDLDSKDTIISGASCTTNALAPAIKVIHDNFKVTSGLMTTIHSYTADQRIQDAPHADLRRARAAAQSMIPTTTGAAVAIGLVMPELKGKLDGLAIRVPTITGSIVDLSVELEKQPTLEQLNAAVKKGANDSLEYCEDPIVSTDVIGQTHGSIYDSLMTKVLEVNGHKSYKVFMWYDNEFSYVWQLVRTLKYFAKL